MTVTSLADLADRTLAAAEDVLTAAGRPPFDRVFRSHGIPAWDLCTVDTLVVYVASLTPTPGTTGRSSCAVAWRADVHVQIIRCAPTLDARGNPPAVDALDASAEGLLLDAWALAGSIDEMVADAVGSCDGVTIGVGKALGPQGGVGAWDVPFGAVVTASPAVGS